MIPTHSPFDLMATTYDADFAESATGRAQRRRVWKYLTPLLNEAGRPLQILEINCGTGEDAIQLASLGHQVIATDASQAMIEKARDKSLQISDKTAIPEFRRCAFERLIPSFEGKEFDLVVSNFGGLNCIDPISLRSLAKDLYSLTNKNGRLFLVVMGTCCIREILHYCMRGKFKTAFRRFNKSVNFNVKGFSIRVFYYSPRTLSTLFNSSFQLQKKYPVGIFLPPTYLEEKYLKLPKKLTRLEKLENSLGHPIFSGLADHYCAIFNKTESQA